MLAQRAEDTLVLLDLDSGEYFALEDVAARVWELCDGERDVATIVDTVIAEYDATAAEVRADVLAFVDELIAASLLTSE